MPSYTSVALLALAAAGEARQCTNVTVPVTISARQGTYSLRIPQNNLDVSQFALNNTRQGSNFTQQALTGYNTTQGTYSISAMYCQPDNFTTGYVQVLTHGIGFDKTYWDLSYNNYNYSYVNSALNAGYATLSYDRLGIGNSSHFTDPINEGQAPIEVAALRELTHQLRTGTLPQVNQTFGNKIVHVGHSFGSAQTYAFAANYPNETAGIILTGFSVNGSFVSQFGQGANFVPAATNQPLRLGTYDKQMLATYLAYSPFGDLTVPVDVTTLPPGLNYPSGYVISNSITSNEQLFFFPGYFDPQILIVAEQTKQPVTYGELLTLGSIPMTNSFRGPTLVITGQHDVPYCGGDCLATGGAAASIPAGAAMAFGGISNANFTSYIQPNTGHGINTHYNATGAYSVIQTFLGGKGLKS